MKKKNTNKPKVSDELVAKLLLESDRGCVLVGAAFLEEQIKAILRQHFISDNRSLHALLDEILDGRHSSVPFGTAGWAIHKAMSLDIFPKDVSNGLLGICRLRNKFAHVAYVDYLELDEVQKIWNSINDFRPTHVEVVKYIAIIRKHTCRRLPEARASFIALATWLWCVAETALEHVIGSGNSSCSKHKSEP